MHIGIIVNSFMIINIFGSVDCGNWLALLRHFVHKR
jgi:hypothetical protein